MSGSSSSLCLNLSIAETSWSSSYIVTKSYFCLNRRFCCR
jgi:hypothetical protein